MGGFSKIVFHRESAARTPGIADLFRGDVLPVTLKTVGVCALSLTAWWAFMFWHPQHLRNLPELAGWDRADRERLVESRLRIRPAGAGETVAQVLAREPQEVLDRALLAPRDAVAVVQEEDHVALALVQARLR